jgi:serine/threonine protein kinase
MHSFHTHDTLIDESMAGETRLVGSEEASRSVVATQGKAITGNWSYRLDHFIGNGAFGSVWRATCLDHATPGAPPETVAVKFFRAARDRRSRSSIRREMAALVAMDEPHIPRLHDWSELDDGAFLVMDYFPGGTLTDRITGGGKLSTAETWDLLEALLSALKCAHRASILHLDIKPSNVLLDPGCGFALADFGISQANHAGQGSARTTGLGSPGYQAPEQRNMVLGAFDTRTDLYGIGATVWAAYAGVHLAHHQERFLALPLGDPVLPPVSTQRVDADPRLDEILASLLRLEKAARPGGAAEVLALVREARSGNQTPPPYTILADDSKDVASLLAGLLDPLWAEVHTSGLLAGRVVHFPPGVRLCTQGETAYMTFILLKGTLDIEFDGRVIDAEQREGTFIGEVATLTGTARSASVIARSDAWCAVMNAAELETLLASRADVSLRLVKRLAERLVHERTRD